MSSRETESLLLGKTTLYLADFLCEFCFGSNLIYFVEEFRAYPQKPIEFLCPHCKTLSTNPLQMHHKTKKVNVKKIEDTIILSLLAKSTRDKLDSSESDCEGAEVVFFAAAKTISQAQSALMERYNINALIDYLQQEE